MDARLPGIVDRFVLASDGFARILRRVRPEQWAAPTPCDEWDVRALTNHMARGNLNYVELLDGGTAAGFIDRRDDDALGGDPVGAYGRSVRTCAAAFARDGALDRDLDYPLGRATGAQLLAVRTTDTVVHTWDLARAIGHDETLDAGLVSWALQSLAATYAGLRDTPADPGRTDRFFAAPADPPAGEDSGQDRLLRIMGRRPR